MLFMSDNQACARLKFLFPCLTLVNRWLLRSIRIALRAAAAVTRFSDHDITLKWQKKFKNKGRKETKRRGKKKENLSWAFAKFCLLVLSKSQ